MQINSSFRRETLQVAPSFNIQGSNDNDGSLMDCHRTVLTVLPAQKVNRSSVLLAAQQYPGLSRHEDVSQFPPVLAVAVDHQRYPGIGFDVL